MENNAHTSTIPYNGNTANIANNASNWNKANNENSANTAHNANTYEGVNAMAYQTLEQEAAEAESVLAGALRLQFEASTPKAAQWRHGYTNGLLSLYTMRGALTGARRDHWQALTDNLRSATLRRLAEREGCEVHELNYD